MDDWKFCAQHLRQFLRGWGLNRATEEHRDKELLLAQVRDLDPLADNGGLSAVDWACRYALDKALLEIHRQEEAYWQRRDRVSWILKGDAITTFFFCYCQWGT